MLQKVIIGASFLLTEATTTLHYTVCLKKRANFGKL